MHIDIIANIRKVEQPVGIAGKHIHTTMRLFETQNCGPVDTMYCLGMVVIHRPGNALIIEEVGAVSFISALHLVNLAFFINLVSSRVRI